MLPGHPAVIWRKGEILSCWSSREQALQGAMKGWEEGGRTGDMGAIAKGTTQEEGGGEGEDQGRAAPGKEGPRLVGAGKALS